MKTKGVHIMDVLPGSIASELGIEKGDRLLTINGAVVKDILEYRFLTTDEFLELEIEKPNGEIWILELEKDYDEDVGIVFDGIIDNPRSCHNKCIFCFIDQLPQGMRQTMYFKDDDTRLSFLQGNFVTLTNLKPLDIEKIIRYRISPINVSVHSTDPELRTMMLNNKNAGRIMEYLAALKEGGIQIKAQVVLCPGINDEGHLEKTIADLASFYPELECMAVVPAGLTKYREGLYPLKPFDREGAAKVIEQVEGIQKKYRKNIDTRFVFLSDEFYILAGKPLPDYDAYEGFPQLENGVGLITLLQEEIQSSLAQLDTVKGQPVRKAVVATGEYAAPFVQEEAEKIKQKIDNLDLSVCTIKNNFFGQDVKVAGLLTGQDLVNQLSGLQGLGTLLITDSMLKRDETVFLDDMTVKELETALNARVVICKEDGSDLVENILNL